MIFTELGGLFPLALIHTPGQHLLNVSLSSSPWIYWWQGEFSRFNFYEIAAAAAIGILNFDVEIHEVTMNSVVNW